MVVDTCRQVIEFLLSLLPMCIVSRYCCDAWHELHFGLLSGFHFCLCLQRYDPVSKSQKKKITSLWQTEQKKQSKKADLEVKKKEEGFLLWCCSHLLHLGMHDLRCGTVDAGIKVPSVENPEVTSVFPLKPREGQNIARHASPTARSSFLLLISTFPVHSPSFFSNPFPTF